MEPLSITSLIAGIFKPATELIDALHTSDEERLDARGRLMEVQAAVLDMSLKYEMGVLQARAKIVDSEAKSDNLLASSWRPITMLTFLALIVGRAMGWVSADFTTEEWGRLFTLMEYGLGGYVLGRSAEKVTKTVVSARAAQKAIE